MKKTMQKRSGLVLGIIASVMLCACASQPNTLYQWEGYQSHVYSYLRADTSTSQEKQIQDMEAELQKIRAKGKTPPPGYYAHLGMLYANTGNTVMMAQNFQTEEKLFPESAPYLDYLMSKLKK